jgi:hypothetical protein
MDLREVGLGCGFYSTGSGQGQAAGCCECGDEPSGSCGTELLLLLLVVVVVLSEFLNTFMQHITI